MKLRKRPEPTPRMHSRDALGLEAEQPKPDFFDPLVDFPTRELARLKGLARETNPRPTTLHDDRLNNGWWLSLVDLEFKQLLVNHPKLKDRLKLEFGKFWKEWGNQIPPPPPAWFFVGAGSLIQLYPALRNEMRKDYGDDSMPQLLDKSPQPKLFIYKIQELAGLLQLYPERQAEWFEKYEVHSDQVLQQLNVALTESHSPKAKLELISNLLLIFPDLRSTILADVNVQSIASQRKRALKAKSEPFVEFDFNMGFSLTVIGAEDARIDETGQIQLQLKSRTAHKAPYPLPPRSHT